MLQHDNRAPYPWPKGSVISITARNVLKELDCWTVNDEEWLASPFSSWTHDDTNNTATVISVSHFKLRAAFQSQNWWNN